MVTGCLLATSRGSMFFILACLVNYNPCFHIYWPMIRMISRCSDFSFLCWLVNYNPCRMFVESCKRLRIMKSSEAIGLGQCHQLKFSSISKFTR
jgi:hypothetical protein